MTSKVEAVRFTMISDREVIARIAQRMRKGKSSLTQEQAQKELIKIKERIDRKKGE